MEKDNGDENFIKRAFWRTVSALKRVWEWIKRAFTGRKGLETSAKIESPSALVRQAFFSKKSAVAALIVFLALLLFTFVAPLFVPLDVNYTDPLQQNVSPSMRLRALPKELQRDAAYIGGFADFTVGLSGAGKVYVWGNTDGGLQGGRLDDVPQVVKAQGAAFVAAGKDHILAVTKSGNVVGWGDNSRGQYGDAETLGVLPMPKQLRLGVDAEDVASLSCGYQVSALVMKSGKAFVWGNLNAVRNLSAFENADGMARVVFTNAQAIGVKKDGLLELGGSESFTSAISSKNGAVGALNAYTVGRKVLQIATDNKCVALVLDGGETVVSGAFENGEDKIPRLADGEYFTQIDGGSRHFVAVSNLGKVYAWGHNAYGQCAVENTTGERVFAGAMQTYVKTEKGVKALGLKGYLMGTDGRGRDVFARIVHGGKTTLTIGAVAVIVSTVIGILVGCTAGYFGGFIDAFLMRVTEIFSAIPFLPFAMLLSQIIKNYSVTETARMLIIMLILGALSWTGLARIIRAQVLAEREKEFVTAARAIGVGEGKIAFRHVLPNVVSVLLVSMTLDFAGCLLTESSLSYLGFGVQQPRPTWGNMLTGSNSSVVIQNYWWQWLFPALFLSVAVICINVIGDALRDALDTKNG